MRYKIYPTDEDSWLKTFRKIKRVAKESRMFILNIDLEDSTGQYCDYKLGGYHIPSGISTVITLAKQETLPGILPPLVANTRKPNRDFQGRFCSSKTNSWR